MSVILTFDLTCKTSVNLEDVRFHSITSETVVSTTQLLLLLGSNLLLSVLETQMQVQQPLCCSSVGNCIKV